jgi:uncharacterized protein (TIGR02266 family)
VPGLYVTYETSAGKRIEADVLDVAPGGIFIRALTPMAAGKRLALEIRLAGSASPWPAVADVVWTRGVSPVGPAGMGVKLVEAEEAVMAAIERLVATRERAVPRPGPKARDRMNTLMGVGAMEAPTEPSATEAAPPPAVANATPTVIVDGGADDVAPAPAPAEPAEPAAAAVPEAEQSLALDLLVRKPVPAELPSDASMSAAGIPVRRRRWPLVVLLIVAFAAGAIYVERGRIPWARLRAVASRVVTSWR